MEVKSRTDVRKAINAARAHLYDCDTALDNGDREALIHAAKLLVIFAGNLVTAITRWYFTPANLNRVDPSWGLFPPSAPPLVPDNATPPRTRRHQ